VQYKVIKGEIIENEVEAEELIKDIHEILMSRGP
jgi:hypothetical protein